MLLKICSDVPNMNHVMLWAACCTCFFFSFLQSGELTIPSAKDYDPGAHGDVTLDSYIATSVIQVVIKSSKTNLFQKGVKVYLGREDKKLPQ